MSQSPASMLQTPNPMKKKILAALMAVVIGHVGVLFAVSQMKTPELKKIEKDPIKIRFVQIKEDAPPPAEPVKPQVQPKPEPKVIKPEPVVKPKIIAEKTQQQTEKTKSKDDTAEKQKLENERLEQQRKNQERLDQQQREQAQRDQVQRDQAERERKAQEQAQAERDRLAREQAARNTPRTLSQGQISWVRSPKPSYTNKDLQGSDRVIVVAVEADTSGRITNVRVTKSSGISALDQKIVRSVKSAKFRPYKENGVAYPFKAEQPFELKLNSNG